MSYIANLVYRTLGVTPVAQPVIQAKFAPPSQTIAAAGQDFNASRTTAPMPRAAQSLLRPQTEQLGNQPRMLDAQTEPAVAREGRRILSAHLLSPVETADAHSAAIKRESVARPAESSRFATLTVPRVPVEAQSPDTPDWPQRAAQTSDDFRLMKAAPSTQAASGFRPSSSTHGPAPSRFRETESIERPIVRVHIGRVDVRMVTPGAKEPRTAIPAALEAKPASLDDYLRARQRGTR
jgi:hypothetical protein